MNMKKNLQYIVVPLVVVVALYACKKDLGNYDYDPANVITITTDVANVDPLVVINNDSIVVKQNDSLKVNILLTQTKPSSDLAFEWMIIQSVSSNQNPPQYIVGNSLYWCPVAIYVHSLIDTHWNKQFLACHHPGL